MTPEAFSLEQRLSIVEDKLAIYLLVASHPLSADTGHGPFFPEVYTDDAVFDRGAAAPGAVGRADLAAWPTSATCPISSSMATGRASLPA